MSREVGAGTVFGIGGSFTGAGGGVVGHDTVNDGTNRVGVQGVADSTGGAGVVGTATAGTGQAAGMRGFSASTGGAGLFAQATATSGVTAGARGVASSTSGFGVAGELVSGTPNTDITGGAGVALPAAICNFTEPVAFLAMMPFPYLL